MSYSQEVYDAVRSKISGGDIGEAVRDVCRRAFDISHTVTMLQQDFSIVASEMMRPSVLYKPELFQDDIGQWHATYGDYEKGVSGCGNTPYAAMAAFDKAWNTATEVLP